MFCTKKVFVFLSFFLVTATGWAENSTAIPGFTIHHNAIPSALLEPSIARQYGI